MLVETLWLRVIEGKELESEVSFLWPIALRFFWAPLRKCIFSTFSIRNWANVFDGKEFQSKVCALWAIVHWKKNPSNDERLKRWLECNVWKTLFYRLSEFIKPFYLPFKIRKKSIYQLEIPVPKTFIEAFILSKNS